MNYVVIFRPGRSVVLSDIKFFMFIEDAIKYVNENISGRYNISYKGYSVYDITNGKLKNINTQIRNILIEKSHNVAKN